MNYISMADFLMNRVKLEDLSPEMYKNANITVTKVNDLLDHFGQYRKCTSGYRSSSDQQRINPKATHSKHMECLAIDVSDPDGSLDKWCLEHLDLLESIGLWLESPDSTIGWTHLQASPPASGHRVFIP